MASITLTVQYVKNRISLLLYKEGETCKQNHILKWQFHGKAFEFTRMGGMFVHEIQFELSCIFLHLDNKSVRMLQILESSLDLVKPIYSFQLGGHRIFLDQCATLHTSDKD